MTESPHLLTLSEQARMVREGDITAVELVKAHLAEIERLNPRLNSFITVDAENAIKQADVIDKSRAAGEKLGPLAGVTVGVKDSMVCEQQTILVFSKIGFPKKTLLPSHACVKPEQSSLERPT
ncbi:MAG TPA: hypothetical protein DHV68_01990 [Dehalococcoidia bacterium]|nr:hypothetical protein [Chloroflexota bacterium]MBH65975.1 hypothetical protein [Chloroflexota bacterium]HCI85596.1 hypothetical protein [Dehalococcoidia bacterium]|tara:strand:+ start:178 stop:546 length:369 start_codon:yes stop_codon:yes gene_type:complete